MTPQSLNPKRSKQEVEEIMCLNQKNSPLLRLPAEIRNKIFALALGEMTIYWGLVRQTRNYIFRSLGTMAMGGKIQNKKCSYCYDRSPGQVIRLSSLVSLPAVCRQIRTEEYLLPFILNNFEIYLADVISFKTKLNETQRSAITTLRLGPYGEVWHIVGRYLSKRLLY
ncbi:hypothetical protein PTNB73_09815 [Pyrenophora teres f. teres]|nr:hypothetical protein PTNB73_09815 [Pyrenophora teres f. teres]